MAVVVAALVSLMAGAAHAQQRSSGIQLTPDSRMYLINKNFGPERWAIALDLDGKSITGNVFYPDGRKPQFLWCELVELTPDPDPEASGITVDCYAAPACEKAPCDEAQWTFVARVPVTGDFLFPPGTASTLSGNVQPILTRSCAKSGACHSEAGRKPRLAPGLTLPETLGVAALQDSSKEYVAPFDSEASYLFDKILGVASSGATMPPDAAPLDGPQIEAIRRWILEGAANN